MNEIGLLLKSAKYLVLKMKVTANLILEIITNISKYQINKIEFAQAPILICLHTNTPLRMEESHIF